MFTPSDFDVPDGTVGERRWGAGSVATVLVGGLVLQIGYAVVLILMVLDGMNRPLSDPETVTVLLERTTEKLTSSQGIAVAFVLQWAWFLGGPWAVSHLRGLKSLRRDIGLRFTPSDLIYGISLGFVLQGFAFVAANIFDMSGSDNTNMVTDHTGVWLLFIAVGACLITPLCEEVFFRGFLLRAIMRTRLGGWFPVDGNGVPERTKRGGAIVAVLITSIIFGSLHATTDGSLAHSLPLMALTGTVGVVLATVTIVTRRLGTAIIAHCVFNTFSVVSVLIADGRLF